MYYCTQTAIQLYNTFRSVCIIQELCVGTRASPIELDGFYFIDRREHSGGRLLHRKRNLKHECCGGEVPNWCEGSDDGRGNGYGRAYPE